MMAARWMARAIFPASPMPDPCPTTPQVKFVDNSTGILDPYLELATQYGWANYMFQTNQGPSFPAHQFIFGGTSAPNAIDDAVGVFAAENMLGTTANQNKAGCLAPKGTFTTLVTPERGEQDYLSMLNFPRSRRRLRTWVKPMTTTCGWTFRLGGGDINRIRALAQELIGLQPDVILSNGT
jgi:hypothetical protein